MISFCISIFFFLGFVPLDTLEIIYPSLGRGTLERLNDKDASWKLHRCPLTGHLPEVSSYLSSQGNNHYGPSSVEDLDLRTAWVFSGPGKGVGEYIEFVFDFPSGTSYGSNGAFNGELIIYNGYCKSMKVWEENSRVKRLKVYYNNIPICYLEVQNVFYSQNFKLQKYFKNSHSKEYMDAPYELVKGDRLRFEIVEVYKGRKYDDVAISEILQSRRR